MTTRTTTRTTTTTTRTRTRTRTRRRTRSNNNNDDNEDAARSMSCPQVQMKSPSLFPSPDPYRHRRCAKLYNNLRLPPKASGEDTGTGPAPGFKGCRPCRRPRKNGQWMKPNWHQYYSVLRTFRFSPFSYVYFYAIYLIKYFDIVRKPTHQTPSPPWAVPRRLQPECGSWAREIIHFIK